MGLRELIQNLIKDKSLTEVIILVFDCLFLNYIAF